MKDGNNIILQQRDRNFFQKLALLRLVDREQAKNIAAFKSTTRANVRLKKLTDAGFLSRSFHATEKGGKKALYSLSPKIAKELGLNARAGSSLLFAAHQLAINEVYIAATKDAKSPQSIRQWKTFTRPLTASILLVPDAYIEFSSDERIRAMFVEVDMGTESHSVWQKKIANYLLLARSGEFSRLTEKPQFGVLVLVSSERRLQAILELVRKYTNKIFWFATHEAMSKEGFWSTAWLRPNGDRTTLTA